MINGYAAKSASNVVSGAITGVTLDLSGASAADTPTTLTIAANPSTASTSIGTFVTAVNGVLSAIQTLGGYDASTQTAGALNGNATLESFQNQLENILDTVKSGNSRRRRIACRPGHHGGCQHRPARYRLRHLGQCADRQHHRRGQSSRWHQRHRDADEYADHPVLRPGGLLSSINQGLQTSFSNVSQQQTALQAELATYSATLTSEYNAMDTAVASLKETQTYLTAEFNPTRPRPPAPPPAAWAAARSAPEARRMMHSQRGVAQYRAVSAPRTGRGREPDPHRADHV